MRFVDNSVSGTVAIPIFFGLVFFLERLWSSGWRGSMGSPHPPEREKKPSVGLKDMAVEQWDFVFPSVYIHVWVCIP